MRRFGHENTTIDVRNSEDHPAPLQRPRIPPAALCSHHAAGGHADTTEQREEEQEVVMNEREKLIEIIKQELNTLTVRELRLIYYALLGLKERS